MTTDYATAWQSYWEDLPAHAGEAIWDSHDTALTTTLLRERLPLGLPMVDLGCGNGTQTRQLAGHCARVIGVDLSRAALDHARRLNSEPNITYQCLDLCDPDATDRLRRSYGDCDVHMRYLLHQLPAEHRPALLRSITTLLGLRGRLLAIELDEDAHAAISALARQPGGPLPKLARALDHGIRPAQLTRAQLERLLSDAGLRIRVRGRSVLRTTQRLPDDSRLTLPAVYLVADARAEREHTDALA
ncbi:class I SAM-dependent methyltransferase [Streptomyces sp. NPDC127068]|uniref:class I SAM-dependent methyltransferase n=1 Tax=Streptomyces sp. NPDC127068 TaxID=3347127 RepID=UPI00365069CD